jgi:hypothetical protein
LKEHRVPLRYTAEDLEDEVEYDDSVPPLWQSIIHLGAALPPEEWDGVPSDLASNLDRYLYGGSDEEQ